MSPIPKIALGLRDYQQQKTPFSCGKFFWGADKLKIQEKKQKKSTTATIQISIHNRQIGMQKFLDSSNCTWITFHEYTTHSGHTHAIPYHPTSSSSLSSSNIPHNKTRDHHL